MASPALAGAGGGGSLMFGDLDGDGTTDVVFEDTVSDRVGFMLLDSMGSPAAVLSFGGFDHPGSTEWALRAVSDINNDDKADLIWQNIGGNEFPAGTYFGWQMDGMTIMSFGPIGSAGAFAFTGMADLSGDGGSDIIVTSAGGQMAAVQIDPASPFSPATNAGIGPRPANSEVVFFGDIDNDGDDDILFENSTNDTIPIWKMTGPAISSGLTLTHPGTANWQIEAFTDINADGNSDIIFGNIGDGRMVAWTLSADGAGPIFTLPAGFGVVGQGDFNAGGMGGLMLRNSDSPASLLRAQTQNIFATAGATLARINNDKVAVDPIAQVP